MAVCLKRLSSLCLFLILTASAQGEIPVLTNKWAVRIRGRNDSTPALAADGSIYFGTWEGNLMALRANGSLKWVFRTGREIRSSPALGPEGSVYFGSRDRTLYAVDQNGQKKWGFRTGGWVDSSPGLGNDATVYFGSWDKKFYAVSSEGAKKWVFQTGGPVVSSPAIGRDGTIYFGSHDGKFYALNPSGTKHWEYSTHGPILSSPAIGKNGELYFTSADGVFYSLTADGVLRWQLRTGGVTESSPILGPDGTIYVGVNKKLWSISPEGKEQWEQEVTTDAYQQPVDATPLVLADNSICVVSGYGLLVKFNQARAYQWSFSLQGHGHASPTADSSGTIYIGGHVLNVGSFFYALATDVPIAHSPWPKFRGDLRNTGSAIEQQP